MIFVANFKDQASTDEFSMKGTKNLELNCTVTVGKRPRSGFKYEVSVSNV